MKLLLLEVYYRSAYVFIAVCFIECLTYLIEGTQLEYFSGLFTFSYQTIEFDFWEDSKQKQLSPNLSLGTNEAKSWFYLFIVYLSYFYCVELDNIILYCLLTYIKVIPIMIFLVAESCETVLPGILKKGAPSFFFAGAALPILAIFLDQHIVLLGISSVKEFQLEPLDSELI